MHTTMLPRPSTANYILGIIFFVISFVFPVMVTAQDNGISDEYVFDLGITYEVSTGKEGKMKKGEDMIMWFSKGSHAGMQAGKEQKMFMVYDMEGARMITLMEDQKMAMVIGMKKMMERMAEQASTEESAENDAQVTKTGRTETILGYKCEEYKITSSDSESNVWITTELGQGLGSFSKTFSTMMQNAQKNKARGGVTGMHKMAEGVMLRMEGTSNKGKEKTLFEAKAVHKDGKKVTTSGYQVMKMPGQ